MRAYAGLAEQNWLETVAPCTLAALGDVLLTLLIYGIGALGARDWRWASKQPVNAYATGSLLGLILGIAIERVAKETGAWRYAETMPIIPLVDAGLWPLLQLALLVPVSWWIANRWGVSERSPVD